MFIARLLPFQSPVGGDMSPAALTGLALVLTRMTQRRRMWWRGYPPDATRDSLQTTRVDLEVVGFAVAQVAHAV
jgi:hypothetical protein